MDEICRVAACKKYNLLLVSSLRMFVLFPILQQAVIVSNGSCNGLYQKVLYNLSQNMNCFFHLHNQIAAWNSGPTKSSKCPERTYKGCRFRLLILLLFVFTATINAQDGPFLRISLGPGFLTEYGSLKESGFTYAAKNHAIGWGFNDRYAVYFSETGAFTRQDIGEEYQLINLDAYGLGLGYNTANNIGFHVSGGYGTVHFSDSWKKQGDFIEDGFAISLGINKKWGLAKRIDLGVGPLISFFKTNNYTFTNLSINFWLDLFLFPQE